MNPTTSFGGLLHAAGRTRPVVGSGYMLWLQIGYDDYEYRWFHWEPYDDQWFRNAAR